MIATAQWIKQQPWHSGKIGYIGFSHGGGTAENLSKVQDSGVDAIVEYYPKCQKVNRPSFVPVQIHLGAEDDWDDPKLCDPYIGRDNYEVYLYQGATHAFERNAPDRTYKGHQLRYNRVAAEQAEQRTREFFRKYVK
jgi:dienelactone hydrolase